MTDTPATLLIWFHLRSYAAGDSQGVDSDEPDHGAASERWLYQLVRPRGTVGRKFDAEFLDAGVEACVFTFG